MLTTLGVNFGRDFFLGGGGPETLEKTRPIIRDQNSLPKFAEKVASNFPKLRQTKIKNSPQIRSAGPRDQQIDT